MQSEFGNHEMVTLARESRGMTQADLANETGLAQGTVSKIENGLLDLTEDSLEAVSSALRYPRTFFLQEDRVYGAATPCLHHRRRKSMSAIKLRQVHAVINVMRMQTSRLLRDVEVESTVRFQHMDPDEYGSVEEIAQLVRASWRLPMGPIRSVTQAIEGGGGIVIASSFGTDKLDAISQWEPPQPPLFFVSDRAPGDRLRFNLAHELGHIVMHDMPTPEQEAEADRFAAEFLMPAREIEPDLHGVTLPKLANLKRYWGVSMAALIMRARDVGTITDRQKRSLFMRLSQLGYRKREPVEISREQPALLRQVIDFHRTEHGYSIGELSRVANLSEPEFREVYLTEETPHLRLVEPASGA